MTDRTTADVEERSEPGDGAPAAEGTSGGDGVPPSEPEEKKGFQFPSAFTVLVIVLLIIWLLTFIIPSGAYEVAKDGGPIPGSYTEVPAPLDLGEKLRNLFLAPVNGLYGNESSRSGFVGPNASGTLFGAAQVFLFVLAIGAFITVMFETGALNAGIARLAYKTRARGWLMIVAIMSVFSLLGTVEGMAEETLGFYGLIVPLMLAYGYDRMVAVGVIIVGAGVGVMGSTVNPFSIGVASGFADVSIGDGIGLRALMWIVFSVIAIAYVVRYANRVAADPSHSLVGFRPGDREQAIHAAEASEPEPLSTRHKLVLTGVVATFTFMIFSIIPWASIVKGDPDALSYSWQLDWWFPELTALFLVATVLLGILGGLGEKRLTDTIARGAGDFIYPALVIVLARAITVVMTNNLITDTVLHSMEDAASGVAEALFAPMVFLVNLPLAFLIPSTSGHATLAMPILAPLGDFAGVSRALVITAWNAASGWMNLFIPTSAVVMGGLALAKVGYDKYMRFVAPLLAVYFVLIIAMLAVAAVLE